MNNLYCFKNKRNFLQVSEGIWLRLVGIVRIAEKGELVLTNGDSLYILLIWTIKRDWEKVLP
jgi:hypothetical protein